MDTKRLILAIALSIIVITIYQLFFMPKPQPLPRQTEIPGQEQVIPGEKEGAKKTTDQVEDISDIFAKKEEKTAEIKTLGPVKENIKAEKVKEITVETDLYTAVFTSRGAGLKSFILKKHKDDKLQPLNLISVKAAKFKLLPFYFSTFSGDKVLKDLNSEKFVYEGETVLSVSGTETEEVVFKYADAEKNLWVKKRFTFSNNYIIGIECEFIKEGETLPAPLVFGPDLENNIKKERMGTELQIAAYTGSGFEKVKFAAKKTIPAANPGYETAMGNVNGFFYWVAYERAYFAAIFKRTTRDAPIKYYILKEKKDNAGAAAPAPQTEEGKKAAAAVKKFHRDTGLYYIVVTDPRQVYLGPKDEEILSSVTNVFMDATEVIDYGFLGAIAKILLKGINFIYHYVPNYGWALVIFTIFLKILLFPLTYQSSVSMAKMQTLQPKIKAIKKKYKNMRDPDQRKQMNVETMALYKQEKVNPMGGCLPLLLQMPILLGFFNLLRTSISVRHEPWMLWVQDLSLKDPIYLLPILMGVSQLVVQKMSPTSADSTQKKMMYIMPLVMLFIVINLPSGLTLYWFISNLLQIGQQHIINKKIYHKKKEEERQKKVQKRKKGKG
ncbi:MAG: membrane protein insertase YidC [Candidatus Aminicenantes bacterium]|nr:membrane protein insertase YidC [Candidatus Aminicenantes bacterium]